MDRSVEAAFAFQHIVEQRDIGVANDSAGRIEVAGFDCFSLAPSNHGIEVDEGRQVFINTVSRGLQTHLRPFVVETKRAENNAGSVFSCPDITSSRRL
jgi:hypothetical protein